MWRRGEWIYALLVFLALLLEGAALAYLGLVLTARAFGALPYGQALGALLLSVWLTALVLGGFGVYILLYHAYTEAKEGRERALREAWLARFTEALFGGPLPPPPWPRPALEALLSLRETLKGEMAEQVTNWLRQARPPWEGLLRSRLASRPARLEAMDALAQARFPEALPALLPYLEHKDPVLRLAAARAAARLAAPEDAPLLGEALLRSGLPRGGLLEILLLLEDRALPVLEAFLDRGGPRERWAALEATGRLRRHDLVEKVLPFLAETDPELKAAALRALWRLGHPPSGYEGEVLAALFAPQEFLRVQAVRVLPLLGNLAEKALWNRLGDPSFYVRRAAAEALKALNPDLLAEAARAHPDPYARAMARQVLEEAA
ncbi:HEAT repeat domain-containing protein [Thermus filiformis]|uniref:PBS lyase n=1 Tax=Thermus filiformis TaxID=276 RepID=A0A0A2WS79_THEFI|nr:HEAT repeat domain-containing protein [Thermus filiformis]KGQ23031.2 PBS lyase [Thermus filiformis]